MRIHGCSQPCIHISHSTGDHGGHGKTFVDIKVGRTCYPLGCSVASATAQQPEEHGQQKLCRDHHGHLVLGLAVSYSLENNPLCRAECHGLFKKCSDNSIQRMENCPMGMTARLMPVQNVPRLLWDMAARSIMGQLRKWHIWIMQRYSQLYQDQLCPFNLFSHSSLFSSKEPQMSGSTEI